MKIKNRDEYYTLKYKKLLSMSIEEFYTSKEAQKIRKSLIQKYWKQKLCPLIRYYIHQYANKKIWTNEFKKKFSNIMKNSKKFQDYIHSDKYKKEQSERLKTSDKFQKIVHSPERRDLLLKVNPYNTVDKEKYKKHLSLLMKKKWANIEYKNKVIHSLKTSKKIKKAKQKYKDKIFLKQYRQKCMETLSKNKSYNGKVTIIYENRNVKCTSGEKYIYDKLIKYYSDLKFQYYSDKFPFLCDFYIPSLDLYIDYNGSWVHGKEPYINTKRQNIILNKWKHKKSSYYNNAIYTWTDLDVRKRQYKINRLEFFNLKEFNIWFQQQILEK